MKIITQNICPPIPIRCYDWVAWYDGREDWITGSGATEEEAIEDSEAYAWEDEIKA